MNDLKTLFALDPEVIFLNHGSFGAAPLPVLDNYQEWQRQLEKQPVKFLARDIHDHFRNAREALGSALGADPDLLVFIPNATFGVNIVARSIDFQPGDELLTTDHEYGACENTWSFVAEETGLMIIQQAIPLPLPSKKELIEIFESGITKRTKMIFLSQITSPTAVRLPVEEICQLARGKGIPILVDGAHAPGQIPLELDALGADFYTGNCHKWLMAPKGSAFLYVRPERFQQIKPLVVGWGWGENCPYQSDTRLQALLEWWGTIDPASYFATTAAIQFQLDHDWDAVRQNCRGILADCLKRIEDLTGLPSISGKDGLNTLQIGAAEWPGDWAPEGLQDWLYENYRIEIPVIEWKGRWLIRPSVQGYNEEWELEKLVEALNAYRLNISN